MAYPHLSSMKERMDCLKKPKLNSRIWSSNVLLEGRGDCVSNRRRRSRRSCSKSDRVAGLVPNSHSDSSSVDESYQSFLSCLNIVDTSMSLEYEPGVSVSYERKKEIGVPRTHEEEKETPSTSKLDQAAGFCNVPNRHTGCSLLEESYQEFRSRLKIEGSSMILALESGVSVQYEKEKETRVPVTCEEEKDESYQKFLGLLKIEGNSMCLEYEPGVSVTYEQERDTPVGSENLATERTIYSDLTVQGDDNSSMSSHDVYDLDNYGKKLSVILKKPYDQNEYEELLKKASVRKPLIREKHLRSMSKSYATKKTGLSYLDHYPDLAEKIESADCYDRLTLLRGFFFWLENLCNEGAFRPWVPLNSSCKITATSDCELVLPPDNKRDGNSTYMSCNHPEVAELIRRAEEAEKHNEELNARIQAQERKIEEMQSWQTNMAAMVTKWEAFMTEFGDSSSSRSDFQAAR